jgi:hypothetical protein
VTHATLRSLIEELLPRATADPRCPLWPPDVFAVAATALKRSGAYVSCVREWPPASSPFLADYVTLLRKAAETWRAAAASDGSGPDDVPAEVRGLWTRMVSSASVPLSDLVADQEVCGLLIQLVALADEASEGLGVGRSGDAYLSRARYFLFETDRPCANGTLNVTSACDEVHWSKAIVLPKMRTPQVGMTLRSLSHHLALWDSLDVFPEWHLAPGREVKDRLNLLLLPWPLTIDPTAFHDAALRLANLPPRFGSFDYTPVWDREAAVQKIGALKQSAEAAGETVNAIVLPEFSLPDGEASRLADHLKCIVIGGEHRMGSGGGLAANTAVVASPHGSSVTSQRQGKHHRWQLSKSQIEWYGLGLDPAKLHWECIELRARQLHFWCLSGSLAFAVLICEDLARQEPAAELVRTVGPNLVVALLMDGAQKPDRWSARYATVLADDPGSSVLTMTSIGMTMLGKGATHDGGRDSRTFALWREKAQNPVPIRLDAGAEAVLLKLRQVTEAEWTADGRNDGGAAGTLVMDGDPVQLR